MRRLPRATDSIPKTFSGSNQKCFKLQMRLKDALWYLLKVIRCLSLIFRHCFLSFELADSFSRSNWQSALNGPFAASGHMVHAGGQAAHWDIQNKATSSR